MHCLEDARFSLIEKWPYVMLTFWKNWNRFCNLPWAPSRCQCPPHQAIWHGCSLIPTKNRPQQQKVNCNLHEFLCEITINTGSTTSVWNEFLFGDNNSWKHKWIFGHDNWKFPKMYLFKLPIDECRSTREERKMEKLQKIILHILPCDAL